MLHQIRVRYDELEDRLQLTLQTQELTHHLLLTRRVWLQVRQLLQQLLDASAMTPAGLPAPVRAGITAAHHHALATQTTARRETDLKLGAPAGAALVTGLRVGRRKTAAAAQSPPSWLLRFERHEQPELRMTLSDKTLHALISALLQREDTAQWSLPALPAKSALAWQDKPTLQ